MVWVWDPPDDGGSPHGPGLSVASHTNLPVCGAGTVTEPWAGPKPGLPALPGQGRVVGKRRLADVGSQAHTHTLILKYVLLDTLDSVHWQ